MDVYERTDKLIADAKLEEARQFNTVRRKVAGLADFDEINTLTKRLYFNLEKRNRKLFNAIMAQQYRDCLEGEVSEDELDDLLLIVFDDELDEILSDYDPVMGYVYNHETERKRDRLYEKVISVLSHKRENEKGENDETLVFPSNNEVRDVFDSAFRQWSKMTEEYGIRSHDRATVEAFHALGVKNVQWHAQNDRKTCSECDSLDGAIFPIDEVPDKPHPNCRCWITIAD